MHSSCIFFALCATTALAGPLGHHQHSHMDFHQRKARDNSAAGLLSLLESEAPAGSFPPPGANEEIKIVEAPTHYTTVTENAPTASPPPASSSTPPAPKQGNNGVKEKISGPPVAQPNAPGPAPVVSSAAPAASSAPASSGNNNLPNLPTNIIPNLSSDDQTYKDLALLHHNIHRANHTLPNLTWNDTLAGIAKTSAETCVYQHTSPVPSYGQNIAAGNSPGSVAADVTNGFYNNEIGLFHDAIGEYGNNNPNMLLFEKWGHVTQMLWKDTTSVGCYTTSCFPAGQDPQECGPGGQTYLPGTKCGPGQVRAYFLVCNYYPPGKSPLTCVCTRLCIILLNKISKIK